MSKGKGNIKIPEIWRYWTYTHPRFLKSHLQTTRGKRLRILNVGQRNYFEGPDFIDALIEIDGIRMLGDVEFHLHVQDWYRHGHDEDRTYRRVILHGVWTAPSGIPPALESRFAHWVVSEALSISFKRWVQAMQSIRQASLPLHPPSITDGDGLNCQKLEQLAMQRFFRRVDRLSRWVKVYSWNDALYIALAEALGYARNSGSMRKLMAQWSPLRLKQFWNPSFSSDGLYWLVWMKAGGLLPAGRGSLLQLQQIYPAAGAVLRNEEILPCLQTGSWHLSGIRPANHPALRLAVLATLLNHYQNPSLFQKLLELAMARLPLPYFLRRLNDIFKIPYSAVLARLLKLLLNHKQIPQYGLGRQRLLQFAINQLLPLLYLWARQTGNEIFGEYLLDVYSQFPSTEPAAVISRLCNHLADVSLLTFIQRRGAFQQGLLEYWHMYNRMVGE